MTPPSTVLIVEDERSLALAFAAAVRQAGAASDLVATSAQARRKLREAGPYLAIILDIGLPDENGLAFLESLPENERLPTLVVTAHGEIENTIAARKLGVREFFTKPLDFSAFTNALAALLKSVREPSVTPARASESAFLGAAPTMRSVFRQIAHACASHDPVLLRGETGTGKSRVARLIGDYSHTREGLFHVHHPGTTSLADALTKARGGTLVVEDIASLSPAEQAALLHGIETAEGGETRLIAIGGDDLADAVSRGEFRSDLYYRLQVLEVRLPPLRERRQDLPALTDFFTGQLAPGRTIEVTDEGLATLLAHDWPGNLRELRNVVSFAITAATGAALIENRHLPAYLAGRRADETTDGAELPQALSREIRQWLAQRFEGSQAPTYRDLSEALETGLLHELLPRYGGRLARLATDLKANRATLRRRLRGKSEDM